MSVYRLDSQACDSSQTLLVVHLKGIPETLAALESKQFFTVHQWDLDAHLLFTFKELAEMCPLAPSSSWVSFRWSSFPVTPGGQSLRAKAPKYVGTFSISAGSSAWFSVFWFHFMWLPSGTTQATQRIETMATVICACCSQGHRCETLHQETQKQSSESRTLSKLTEPLYNLFKGTLIVTTKLSWTPSGAKMPTPVSTPVPQPIS